MSELLVTSIYNQEGEGAPNFPKGATVTGVITATSFSGSGANLTGIDATALKDGSGNVKIQANSDGAVVTGVITATTGSFTGNVSVGGTLTYEDVTNVDSVGLITARDGIHITGNIGLGGATYGSSGQVLTSGGSGANATWTTISAAPEFTATASGAIANGKTIVLNSDATVSAAATTLTTESIGSVAGIESPAGGTRMLASTWISDTQFLVAWSLFNNPKYVYMAVGTVSGTTITYGTPVQFPNNTRAHSAGLIWDTSVNAGFIALADNYESKFYAYGFTISGTTVSIRAHNSSGYWEYGSLTAITCVRAATNNKGGFAFVSIDSNGLFQSWAGTLNSSANISVGNNSNTYSGFWNGDYRYGKTTVDIAYNPDLGTSTSSTFGVCACHGNGTSLRAALLTDVNDGGTSHTMNGFTSLVTIDNSMGASLTYNTEFNVFYMIYRVSSSTYSRTWTAQSNGTSVQDLSSMEVIAGVQGDYGCAVDYSSATKKAYLIFTRSQRVQGYEISFASSSSITVGSVQNITAQIGVDENFTMAAGPLGKVFAAGSDLTSPYYGDTHIWQTEIITTNVTANNFLGFSAAAYTNGQTVTIKTVGNVDANQTGLTTASKYYLTTGGDLSLTADDPSVYAGLALNSTSIAVKFPV